MDDGGETKEIIERCGVEYELVITDITAEGNCKKVVDTCIERF